MVLIEAIEENRPSMWGKQSRAGSQDASKSLREMIGVTQL